MDSLEELKNSSSQQLRNRFEALHNLLESYEKDYIILKSNIFMNRARRAVYYDFDSNSWENYAEQYFDSHQQQLISSKNKFLTHGFCPHIVSIYYICTHN